MARGYPDFFGSQVFPGYGTLKNQWAVIPALATGATGTLYNILCKGKLFGGYFYVLAALSLSSVVLSVIVDGENVLPVDLINAQNWIGSQAGQILQPTYLDQDTLWAFFAWKGDVTFGQSFRLDIINGSGGNLNINGRISYYQIQ